MGVAPDRFVSAGPLIVGAECSDGTLLVAVHTIFADEPLLLDEEVAVEDKAVAKAQTLQPLPREYRGPFRVYVVDSLGTSMACVGWRADGQILAKYCRYLAKEEKDLFGVSRSSYGSYLALETSSWMARCAVSGRLRALSCAALLATCDGLWLIDVTGAYRIRAHAVGGGILAGQINEGMKDLNFSKMNQQEACDCILDLLTNTDGIPHGSRVEMVAVGGKNTEKLTMRRLGT